LNSSAKKQVIRLKIKVAQLIKKEKNMKNLILLIVLSLVLFSCKKETEKPNIVFVFADQWRAQAMGYAGNPDVQTPNLDKLATEGVNFTHALATMPVCTPYRAMLLTGQYALKTCMFMNDVMLNPEAESFAKQFQKNGYNTAYIGKWHVDGNGRSNFIPKERRQGWEYWKVLECTHNYNNSKYWGNDDKLLTWDGYDAEAQTKDAIAYINEFSKKDEPFVLMLSWGPPHAPYETAPEEFRKIYENTNIKLRPNVPFEKAEQAKEILKGYYAHCTALDSYIKLLQDAIKETGSKKIQFLFLLPTMATCCRATVK
jgi:arylsulfatase A-like enzyme